MTTSMSNVAVAPGSARDGSTPHTKRRVEEDGADEDRKKLAGDGGEAKESPRSSTDGQAQMLQSILDCPPFRALVEEKEVDALSDASGGTVSWELVPVDEVQPWHRSIIKCDLGGIGEHPGGVVAPGEAPGNVPGCGGCGLPASNTLPVALLTNARRDSVPKLRMYHCPFCFHFGNH